MQVIFKTVLINRKPGRAGVFPTWQAFEVLNLKVTGSTHAGELVRGEVQISAYMGHLLQLRDYLI